jgi:hypothetical protein
MATEKRLFCAKEEVERENSWLSFYTPQGPTLACFLAYSLKYSSLELMSGCWAIFSIGGELVAEQPSARHL